MCMVLTVLAHANECRTIAQCEHGTLHVTWDIATVRLRPNDFLALTRFLERHAANDEASANEGWCVVERDARYTRRMWIGQVGLMVSADDFAILVALLGQAAEMLTMATPAPAPFDYPLLTVRPDTFGLN